MMLSGIKSNNCKHRRTLYNYAYITHFRLLFLKLIYDSRFKMLSIATKKLLGLQTSVSRHLGSVPYIWDPKSNRISITKDKSALLYWLVSATFLWSYWISLTVTYFQHFVFSTESVSHADHIFHIFWIIYTPMVLILDANTIYFRKELVFLINNTLDLDDRLTSKKSTSCKLPMCAAALRRRYNFSLPPNNIKNIFKSLKFLKFTNFQIYFYIAFF